MENTGMETQAEAEGRAGAVLRGQDAEARRAAASLMGKARTPRKAASSAANGRLGGKSIRPLAEIACTCPAGGAVLTAEGKPAHPTTCPRGRVIRYRLTKGLPLT